MTLVRWDPFRQMQDTMNRMFDRRLGYSYEDAPAAMAAWSPAVDVREKDGEIVLTAELPGVPLSDIDISLENNVLSISGERKTEKDVEEGSYHWRERGWGRFRRSFTLPSTADRDRIEATYKDGVLQVVVPQKPESKPKQITVKSAA